MAVQIRRAEARDRERCIALLGMLGGPDGREEPEGAAETFDALLTRERGEIWVAEADGAVVGMAAQSFNLALRYGGEYAQPEELIVAPSTPWPKTAAVSGSTTRMPSETIRMHRLRALVCTGSFVAEPQQTVPILKADPP